MFLPCQSLLSDSLHSLSLCPGFLLLVTHCHLDRTIQERGDALMDHSEESTALCQGSQEKQEPPDSMVLVGAPRLTAVALAPSDHHDHLSQPPTSHTCCVQLRALSRTGAAPLMCIVQYQTPSHGQKCTIVHLPFHVTLFNNLLSNLLANEDIPENIARIANAVQVTIWL